MAEFFEREATLAVGPIGTKGLLIADLRFVFKIEKDIEKQPNNATIEIYNLSDESRAIVEEKKSAIILNAGYKNNSKTIFVGDVAKVTTKFSGNDIITSIEAGDGEGAYKNKNVNLSFGAGTRFGAVLESVLSKFGLAAGDIQGVNNDDQFLNGISLVGPAKDQLDELVKRQGLEWSIQDGAIQILPSTVPRKGEAILISPATGLIGSPFKTKIVNANIAKKVDGKEAQSGVKFTSFLNPDIKPGSKIQMESKFVSGTFKAQKIVFSGDTHGKPWFAEVEAI